MPPKITFPQVKKNTNSWAHISSFGYICVSNVVTENIDMSLLEDPLLEDMGVSVCWQLQMPVIKYAFTQ